MLRYEIKDLTPPKEILHAMQQQITAEREKRALIAASEGRRQEQINIATGEREAFIARSEGEKQAVINKAQGEAASITAVANATADAIERVAAAIRQPGGEQAVQLKVAEKAVEAYSKVAADATHHADRAQQYDGSFGADQFGHDDGAAGQTLITRGLQRRTAAEGAHRALLFLHFLPDLPQSPGQLG